MMVRTVVTILCVCFTMTVFANDGNCSKWSFHGRLLKESLDTSRWRNFYPDDGWRIRCIFVDMDGDGKEELIAASVSEEEDRIGWVWNVFRSDMTGKFKQVHHTGDIYFLCHWNSYYRMTFKDGTYIVIGIRMEAGYMDKERIRIISPTPDCAFSITPDGKFTLHEIKPNLDTCFRRETVVSIERLYPEWYFGYDFKPPPDIPHSVYTQRMPYKLPKGDLRHGGGIGSPKDFVAIAEKYRRDVKGRADKKSKVAVYAVFLDADNDGDGDCYMSSDAEKNADGRYAWTLYLRQDGRFLKANNMVYSLASRKESCKLPVRVIADKFSFCRIIHQNEDPTFIVLDEYGQSKSKVRDAITDYYAHRIEKLPCEEFKE